MAKAKAKGRKPKPPKGTLTIEEARLLPGLVGVGDMTVRRTLRPAELGRKWPSAGRGRFTLWNAAKARQLAALRLRPKDEPATTPVPKPRSSVSREVPDGWVTTKQLQEELDPYGDGDPTVRQVRRALDQNIVGPPNADAVDVRICEAFDSLFDRAGMDRLPRRVPSERRLVEATDKYDRVFRKIQRVYPEWQALDWFRELEDKDPDDHMRRQMAITNFTDSSETSHLRLKTGRSFVWRRNPWLPFVEALLGESAKWGADGPAYFLRLFIAKRKARWRAERTDARRIAAELAIQLDLLRKL